MTITKFNILLENMNNIHLKIIVDDALNQIEFQFPPTHTNWC